MKLLNNSIGISDLIAHTECPRRMSYGMRRHTGKGTQSDQRTPEADSYPTAYGSAMHDAIEFTEDGFDDATAVQKAYARHERWLEPRDLGLMVADLETYHQRDFTGLRTVAAEDEYRVPLFVYKGEQIYFRFKLDRLYQSMQAPHVFVHVDYKTSRTARSEAEVHSDIQMWAYNWGIHEFFPECEQLQQWYDQLKFGRIPTRKSDGQRDEIKAWLIATATAVLDDENWQPDGLLAHNFNQWCPWCPVLMDCPVVGELSEWALTRIAALAPMEAKPKKDGSPSKVLRAVPLEADRLPEYAAEMDKAGRAKAVLERFDEGVKGLIKELPDVARAELGYDLRGRSNKSFSPRALAAIRDRVGEDRFLDMVTVTQSRLESHLADDPELVTWALNLAHKTEGAQSVIKRKVPA